MENFLDECDFSVDFEKKEKKILAVGRLHPVKGFDRLLNLWKDIASKYPDWNLVIVGDGEEKENLKNLAHTLSVDSSVTFTGALDHDHVLALMKQSSIYAMTSLTEGFPFVLIEAMSCGLPTVAYDVRVGPRAIINNGTNGILVEDNNREEFQNSLCFLMENDKTRLEYSKMAFDHAKDYTEEKIVQKWLSVFEQNQQKERT